jgi:chemotaxis protein methyltransferase CheR
MTVPRLSASQPGRLDEDVVYTAEDFAKISTQLYRLAGILLTEANERMVYARLSGRVVQLGFGDFASYLDWAFRAEDPEEIDFFISALTTNTTHFYREHHHFEFLETDVLSDLIARAEAGHRIRIWSAGCSTGEEPYSLASCLLNAFPKAGQHDLKILATDVDRSVLERAQTGRYSLNSLRKLPPAFLDRYFEPVPGAEQWTPKPDVRSMVTFRHLNLIGDWPFNGRFDVIFCRNVAIYMDNDTQERLWTRFRDALHPGGFLFIGHSERLSRSLRTSMLTVGNTIFQRTPTDTAHQA